MDQGRSGIRIQAQRLRGRRSLQPGVFRSGFLQDRDVGVGVPPKREDVRDRLMDIMEEVVVEKVTEFTNTDTEHGEWKLRQLADWVNLNFPLGIPEAEIIKAADSGKDEPVTGSLFDGLSPAQFAVCNFISEKVRNAYDIKISFENPDALKEVERFTILSAIDRLWQEHLNEMDSLRYSIGLRGYGQRDPLVEYKAEAFKMFDELMGNVKTQICNNH